MSGKYISLREQSASQQLKFVKSEAKRIKRLNGKNKPHKHYLNLVARKCGYSNYDQLFNKFKAELQEWRDRGKALCSSRTYDEARCYYFVTMHDTFEYSYFSHWTAWNDEGYELRAPSLMNPEWVIKFVRESLNEPLYIIHSKEEYIRWMFFWHGKALVDHDVITKNIITFLTPRRSYSHPRLSDFRTESL
jgi:hypothetical protein